MNQHQPNPFARLPLAIGHDPEPAPGALRARLWRIIFRSDTPAGRAFDLALLGLIATSVVTVMLESVDPLRTAHPGTFQAIEWTLTLIFTVEYAFRLWVVRRPLRYATSFLGLVDLVSILPNYLELVLEGSHYLMILRVLRLLRLFRALRLAHHLGEATALVHALQASRAKISVFLVAVLALVCVEGTAMYLVEHGDNPGFGNIPQAIYWAIVTITTVGYGDVAPHTVLGKLIACVIMLTGFAILAVPTGVVSAELGRHLQRRRETAPARARHAPPPCVRCGWKDHDPRARHCLHCGARLLQATSSPRPPPPPRPRPAAAAAASPTGHSRARGPATHREPIAPETGAKPAGKAKRPGQDPGIES